MTAEQHSDSPLHGAAPGKTRTKWHPLLVRILSFALDSAFKVEQEVSVGKMPLRVDILLIRREDGQLSEARTRDIAELLALLNRFTLIEFKAPTDALEQGDFAQLVACSYLWHSQQSERYSRADISLIIVAPAINTPLREDLKVLGCEIAEHDPGIFSVIGLPFATWIVETDAMAQQGQPILSLVSREFLNDRKSIIDKIALGGHEAMAHYRYMVQQVEQFRSEEDFAMQQAISDDLKKLDAELFDRMIQEAPVERRLRGLSPDDLKKLDAELFDRMIQEAPVERRLRGLPPGELLRVLSPEERLRGLSPEERLRGLSPDDALRALPKEYIASLSEDEVARLREALKRQQGQ